jgi:hypothetical protein
MYLWFHAINASSEEGPLGPFEKQELQIRWNNLAPPKIVITLPPQKGQALTNSSFI